MFTVKNSISKHVLWPVALVCTVLLSGCASEPDCGNAYEAGIESGKSGEPLLFDDSIHDAACRQAFESGWNEGHAIACDIRPAFEMGLGMRPRPEACTDRAYLERFNLGRTLMELRSEQARYEAQLNELENLDPSDRRRIESRLRVLARDIPELEALAQIRGFMPPLELPPELTEPEA